MKPRKSTVLIVLLTFLLAAFAIAMAQGTAQTDQKKKADSCCAEGAEGSCKHEDKTCCKKEGAEGGAECCKTDANKDHADCCGESCEMDAHHDAKAKHDPKKHGDCCKAKNKDAKDAKPKTKAE